MSATCTACSFQPPNDPPVEPSSPYLTALAQIAIVGGDVERVVSWMCAAHQADFNAVCAALREMPPETWPPKGGNPRP